jgi:hypothetical protein
MIRPLAAALLLGLAACSSGTSGGAGAATPYDPAAGSSEVVVELERMPCFGTCPVYKVSLSRSGTVQYIGTRHVKTAGALVSQMPASRVDSLVTRLEAGGYFGFADAYVMDSPACGQYATDSPTVVTTVSSKGRSKTIRHDYGCMGAPSELAGLERLIDDMVGTDRWTGREP